MDLIETKMALQNSINKENLLILMHSFYKKAVEDEILSDFFVDELGDDLDNEEWLDHIDTLADFWLAVLLGEDTYGGNYLGRHYGVPYISRESFIQWVKLFSKTADEIYTPDIAIKFKQKGEALSKEFIEDLGI